MHFALDKTAFVVLFAFLLFFYFGKFFLFSPKAYSPPSLAFSRLNDLNDATWRARFANLPYKLHLFACACLMLAFVDPHLIRSSGLSERQEDLKESLPVEGIALYLVLDQSGSMNEVVSVEGKKEGIAKINLLKEVTKQFILEHPSDLIGLVSFARIPHVLVPLTLDRVTLLAELQGIQVVKKADEDGTAMGYAIYKTATLLSLTRQLANDPNQQGSSPYTIKSAVIIVVTDGFQDPSRLDRGNRLRTIELDEAAAYAKSQNIRLYVINIDSILSTREYAPQRRQLQSITALTGGQFFLVSDAQGLQEIYQTINQLEKGAIHQQIDQGNLENVESMRAASFYPYILISGLFALFLALLLETTLFRKVP